MRRWRAYCSCGWEGSNEIRVTQAAADLSAHEETTGSLDCGDAGIRAVEIAPAWTHPYSLLE